MEPPTAYQPPPNARSVLLSVSPHAGSRSRREHVDDIKKSLAAAGYDARVVTDLDELADLARQGLAAGRLRAVVACGGDGTAALVRNHVPLEVPLVSLPLGTENLLARYLGQSARPEEVCRTIDQGLVIGLDLGRAGDRYFLLMISAGFDAEVIRRLHVGRSGHITRFDYVWPTLDTIRSYAYPELRLYCDQGPAPGVEPRSCRWLFGFNLPLYACGWQLAPDATGSDGLLDVCTFGRGTLVGGLRYLWHITWGSHLRLPDAEYARCGRFRVETDNEVEVPYQLDGDFAGMLPIDVELLPGKLQLLVSPATARSLGIAMSQAPA